MLELEHVSVTFCGQESILAVDDVNLALSDGSRTAIVGETGSGKSVLLLAILRLLPGNAAIGGRVLLDGEDILMADKMRLQQIRGNLISYVPQGGGASMNPLLKVGFQVGEPLMEHRGYRKKQAFAASVALLRRFNLSQEEKLARAYPHTFSGGMRQRAMVAMGIAAGAGIILADEPTKGLDDRRVQLVIDALNCLEQETILCVTHDLNFAQAVSDSVCVMYAAQQVEYGSTKEVLTNPLHPYTQDLLSAMPENGMRIGSTGFAPAHGGDPCCGMGCHYAARCRCRTERCRQLPPVFDRNGHKVRCWNYAAEDGTFDKTVWGDQ